jgi:hypothetical protein
MAEHALLSPSGAHRWMRCPGSLLLEKAAPDRSTRYADEGSAAHLIATECLQSGGKITPDEYLGRMLDMGEHEILVDHEMVQSVEQFIEVVEKYAAGGGQILVDKRVDFTDYLAIEGIVTIDHGAGPLETRKELVRQTGTADVIIIFPDRIIVIDLKYGRGVKVYAEHNEQCRLYALGTLHDFGIACDPTTVTMVIHQPRLEHLDEDTMTVEDLEAWALNHAKPGAEAALAAMDMTPETVTLEPGEKQCKFCNAKAICPALAADMQVSVGQLATAADFAGLADVPSDDLWIKMQKVPLVESYCKAIRAEAERRLFAGEKTPLFKLVEGKKGNRAWSDDQLAEATLKSQKVKPDDMYTKKLASPTQLEKNIKKTKPKAWAALQELIVRAPGKPSVAPATDKRPELGASMLSEFRGLITDNAEEE